MKASFLFLAFLALTIGPSLSQEPVRPQRRIAFARDSTLWIAILDGGKARKLTKGDDPCISPDGTKVAFTMSPRQGTDVVRYIAVSDLATGAINVYKDAETSSIYRASIAGGTPRLLIKNAFNPSVSRQSP
jgi:Tol biopolymer transport system component